MNIKLKEVITPQASNTYTTIMLIGFAIIMIVAIFSIIFLDHVIKNGNTMFSSFILVLIISCAAALGLSSKADDVLEADRQRPAVVKILDNNPYNQTLKTNVFGEIEYEQIAQTTKQYKDLTSLKKNDVAKFNKDKNNNWNLVNVKHK